MINNPQLPQEKLGLVDDISSNSQIGETIKYLESNNKRPVENSFPTINPQQYAPGEIISDQYFNHSNNGIQEVNSYSHNTVERDEARLRQIELDRRDGYSTYNSPPKSSGAPFLQDDGVRLDPQQLQKAQKQAQISALTQQIRLLNDEQGKLNLRLVGVEIALKKAKDQLSELEENRGN